MSAALSPDPMFDRLAALTCPNPSADDLRVRAEFWREYVRTTPLSPACAGLVDQNCAAMATLANRMDNPAPVAVLVPAKVRKQTKQPKPTMVGAEEFWTLHAAAVRAIVAWHGLHWRIKAPSETVLVTLPARLCSYTGPLGGRIKWRRDHRMPAAAYWPGGCLPEGVEADDPPPAYDGPMGDDHPSVVRLRLAREEQIATDRRLAREKRLLADCSEAAAFSSGYPPMLTKLDAQYERNKLDMQAYEHRVRSQP